MVPLKSEVSLLKVIVVQVGVAQGVNKDTWFEMADLGHHVGQECVRGNVERNAKKYVSTSLVELAIQFSISDMKLEKGMAWHQRHLIKFTNVPSRDNDSSAVWIGFDGFDGLLNLVNDSAILGFPFPPLLAIDRSEVSILIGPFVPNPNAVFLEVAHVGVSLQEPEKFMNDGR